MKKYLLLSMLLVNISLGADPKAPADSLKGFELGGSLGFPYGIGLDLQYWNLADTNLLLRTSVSTFIVLHSASGSIGYIVDNSGPFRHAVALAYTYLHPEDGFFPDTSPPSSNFAINYNYRTHFRDQPIIVELGVMYSTQEGFLPVGKLLLIF